MLQIGISVGVFCRELNRLKYCSGSGSRNFTFNDSGSRLFKKLGSGLVRVLLHQKLKVQI